MEVGLENCHLHKNIVKGRIIVKINSIKSSEENPNIILKTDIDPDKFHIVYWQ